MDVIKLYTRNLHKLPHCVLPCLGIKLFVTFSIDKAAFCAIFVCLFDK